MTIPTFYGNDPTASQGPYNLYPYGPPPAETTAPAVVPGTTSTWSPGGTSGITPLTPQGTPQTGSNATLQGAGDPSSLAGATTDEGAQGLLPVGITNAINATLGGSNASNTSTWEGWVNSWIPRIIIVILGFIFIAAGLHMLGFGRPIDQARNSIRAVTGQ